MKYVSIKKYKKCRKIADYIANKLFKMKEKKINFNRKFEFIFLKKIVKKITTFFGRFIMKETKYTAYYERCFVPQNRRENSKWQEK